MITAVLLLFMPWNIGLCHVNLFGCIICSFHFTVADLQVFHFIITRCLQSPMTLGFELDIQKRNYCSYRSSSRSQTHLYLSWAFCIWSWWVRVNSHVNLAWGFPHLRGVRFQAWILLSYRWRRLHQLVLQWEWCEWAECEEQHFLGSLKGALSDLEESYATSKCLSQY